MGRGRAHCGMIGSVRAHFQMPWPRAYGGATRVNCKTHLFVNKYKFMNVHDFTHFTHFPADL